METNIYKKLLLIQSELKAPKGQKNTFGNYKYRSCEDILESVKPLLLKNNTALHISDEIVLIGDRYYIKATATLTDIDSQLYVENIAYAREEETKKGMDGSQITGTASSYARKYALNGLFCIDDTKDADTDEFQKNTQEKPKKASQFNNISQDDNDETKIEAEFNSKLAESESDLDKVLEYYKLSDYSAMTIEQKLDSIKTFNKKIALKGKKDVF